MELRFGWATEYGQHKFDISVSDTDFAQIMAEQGVQEGLLPSITFLEKFTVLEAYGRFLAESESLRVIADAQARQDASGRAAAAQQDLVTAVRAARIRLGLEAAPELSSDKPAA